MKKHMIFALLLSVLAVPALAATAGQTMAPVGDVAKDTMAQTTSPSPFITPPPMSGDVIPLPALDTSMPVAAPVFGTTKVAPMAKPPVIGENMDGVGMKPVEITPIAMSSSANDSPLCAPVAAKMSDDVPTVPAQPVVNPPKTIPLSVELADALGIRGFENIKADGPIGFITMDDTGRVMFEGRDLTQNVQTLCSSGKPIPAIGTMNTTMAPERAPDGSVYSSMPGQKGFRMQPIIDGPSYKYPPKKKKKVVKKVEAPEVVEETLPAVDVPTDTVTPAPEAETTAPTATDGEASLKSMMDAPVTSEEAPATTTTTVVTPAPTAAETGAAVQEILDTTAETVPVPAAKK